MGEIELPARMEGTDKKAGRQGREAGRQGGRQRQLGLVKRGGGPHGRFLIWTFFHISGGM